MSSVFSAGRVAAALLLAASAACSSSSSTAPAVSDPPPLVTQSATAMAAVQAGVVPLAVDAAGAPRLVRAVKALRAPAGASAEQAARFHLDALAPLWQAPKRRIVEAEVTGTSPVGDGNEVVSLKQRIGGVEVYGGGVRVMLTPDRSLAAVSGTLVRNEPRAPTFALTAEQALGAAIKDRWQVDVAPARAGKHGDWIKLAVPTRGTFAVSEAAAKRVLAPSASGALVAAYQVEIFASTGGVDGEARRFVVAADSGRVLEQRDLTSNETFIYRVWADASGERRPHDGPTASFLPHPTGVPDGSEPAPVAPNLVAVETLKTKPPGFIDPWLPADATETIGNNVEAYVDLNAPDGLTAGTDFRADVTSPGAFDRAYDLTQQPGVSVDQRKAATTHLFYTINWLHDWYYDSGFNEAARNAQTDNFGRGGEGADSIKAEAQDNVLGGSRNNANMSTPSDGIRPRMQMFLWSGISVRTLTINGTEYPTNTAGFGPQNFDLTGTVVLAEDGTAPVNNGCEAITNNVAGQIAVIDRGVCPFTQKVQNAQNAGAIGVIIANNAAGAPAPGLGGTSTTITIPTMALSLEDGNLLKAALLAGPVSATFHRVTGVEVDGDLDTGIIAHEWGHYFHHRLTDCGTTQCSAMSEGWGDFVALHALLRAEDDPTGTYGMAGYAGRGLGGPNAYFYGIRRYPYATDRTKNPLSFGHIQASATLPATPAPNGGGVNNEVHNAGEVWASMLFEAYAALLDEYTYPIARRRMADYMVAGLLLAPRDATFTETRDAILTAVSTMNGGVDLTRVAQAFASRGAGSCAVSPARDSVDFNGVVESDQLAGKLALGALTFSDAVLTGCDADGYLDPGELGTLRVTVANSGPVALTNVVVDAASGTTGIDIVAPATIASLAPFTSQEVTLTVQAAVTVAVDSELDLTVSATATGGCEGGVTAPFDGRVGVDNELAVTATDDVEATVTPWVAGAVVGTGSDAWGRGPASTTGHALLGADLGAPTDTFLTSPVLNVDATLPFSVTFDHAYSFEAGGNPIVYYDGGMIEVSSDGGTTWVDATTLTTTPIAYSGTLGTTSENPLGGRSAFSAESAGYPALAPLTLDFGTALAGQAVQLRFRIGTDANTPAPGWEIDNLVFTGITNTPFNRVIDEGPTCQLAPIANAGADQTVDRQVTVDLSAAASSDPNGEALTYAWTQTAGPTVTLSSTTTAATTFVSPDVAADTTITLRVTVADSFLDASDTVDIIVRGPPPIDAGVDAEVDAAVDAAVDAPIDAAVDARMPDAATGGDGDDDGCGCRANSPADAFGLIVPLALVGLALRRRRRVLA